MRSNWWTIAKLELTLALKDREAVVWSLIAPIAMAAIFGAMFGGGGPPEPTRVTIEAGVNPPQIAESFEAILKVRGFEVGEDGIRVQIPDSLLARMIDGRGATASIVKRDESDMRVMAVSAAVREILYALAFRARGIQDELDHKRFILWAYPRLSVDVSTLGKAPRVIAGNEHTLPAMLVMFIMFQLTTFFLVLWVDDLRTGKTKRITMSPTRTRDILLGNLVARVLWAALQVVIILGVGSLVLGVDMGVPVTRLALVLVPYMLTAISLGMLLATFFKTTEKANAVGVIVGLMMAALGGCWWPLEIVPGAMRMVALALPTGQAMDAIEEMMALGPAAPFPLQNVLVLLAMAAIMLPLATRRMRVQLTG